MDKGNQDTQKRVAGSIDRKITATELVEERANKNFDQAQVRDFLWGDKADYASLQARYQEQINDPMMANSHHFYEMTTKEKKVHQFKKLNHIWNTYPEKRKEFFCGSMRPDKCYWYYPCQGQAANVLHLTMFYQSMVTFCTPEQFKTWKPLLDNYDIHGCYA